MAIQMRRGVYSKLDKKRLVPGEFAVVQSGDPQSSGGTGAYVCFSAGSVKKLMTQEDITTEFLNSEQDVAKQITDNATAYVKSAEAARVSAENTRVSNENARKSAESTRVSAENTRISNENARKSAETARETAQAKNNSDQAKNNELAKNGVAYTILTSSQVSSSTGKPTITGSKGTVYFAPTNDTADSDKAYVEWVCPDGAWERISPRYDSGDAYVDANRNEADSLGTIAAAGSSKSVGVDNTPISFEGLANALVAFKTGITSLFAAKSHTHAATDITSGALPVANGGTGQTTLQATRNVLGLGNTTGALPVANGGTGSTTASAARAALGVALAPVILYDNDSAAMTDGATLSETAANFRRLVICYKSDNGYYGSVEVYHPNGKLVALTMNAPDKSGFMTTKGKIVKVNGTDINTYSDSSGNYCGQGYVHSSPAYDRGDYLNITQVIGYR